MSVTVSHYDYDKKETVVDGEVNLYNLAHCLTADQFAQLLEDWLNSYNSAVKRGEVVGKKMAESHRTLQGLFFNFAITAVTQLASDWSDPRNEVAVAGAKKIAAMLKDGTLRLNPFI